MKAETVVRAELAAWDHLDVDEAMKYFAQDAVYYTGPSYPRLLGHDAIRKTLHAHFSRATECDLSIEILRLAVHGGVVLMERFDHWIVNGKPTGTLVIGTYEVKSQKITVWCEHFIPPEHLPLTVYAVTWLRPRESVPVGMNGGVVGGSSLAYRPSQCGG